MSRPAIFFDRDGTLSHEIGYVNHVTRFAPFAFAVANSSVRKVAVRIRAIDFDRVEILSGLNAGQRVVLNPPSMLHDGMKVKERRAVPAKTGSDNVAR